MLVILASQWDPAARSLAARCSDGEAAILTPPDLSIGGWRQRLGDTGPQSVVVGGTLMPQQAISGVLTLLPGIGERHLPHVVPQDRPYVASEMNAFLIFWLSQLKCPVLNRPTPECLTGPAWRAEKWLHVAAQAGISVRPMHLNSSVQSASEEDPSSVVVTVVGERAIGNADPTLHEAAKTLAAIAGVQMLSVRFGGPEPGDCLINAGPTPDLSDTAVADALLGHLHAVPAVRS
jgi:hypothetical protein